MPLNSQVARLSSQELDEARLDMLRRRVSTFGYVLGGLILLLIGVQVAVALRAGPIKANQRTGFIISSVMAIIVMTVPRRRTRNRREPLRRTVHRTQAIVVASVLSQTQGNIILGTAIGQLLRPFGFEGHIGPAFPLYTFFAFAHAAASIIVPWTVLESLLPVLVIAGGGLLMSVTAGEDSWNMRLIGGLMALAAGVPGMAISLFRSAGLRELLALRLIGGKYQEVEHELSMARRIHERLFPRPITSGPIRVSYEYEPMRQIGGDYLDVVQSDDGTLTIAIIDVTGHGVAAALAVHRLHGELKRVMGQRDAASPAAIARALNDYVHLTLADEQVFATAVILRITTQGKATLCIAGHPSPMVVRRSGVEAIESTAMMLGAFSAADFFAEEAVVELAKGESLVLYTDGATEAMNADHKQLGTEGLRHAIATIGAVDTQAMVVAASQAVRNHRTGAVQDDTLLVCVSRV